MTTNTSAPVPTTDNTHTAQAGRGAGRPPATAIAAAALAILASAVGGYGSIYFTGLEGFTDLGLTFLVAYDFLALVGLVSAVGLLRGRAVAQAGTVLYGTFMVVFTIFKVAYIKETEAIPFGVVGLAVVALALAPATRRFATR